MKKQKTKFREAIIEALLELLLTAVCFGIGALVLFLFGVNLDSTDLDFELIVLIGISSFVLLGVICALVQWIKNKKEKP